MRKRLNELIDQVADHGDHFRKAVKDLVDQRNILSQDLVENWGGFMSSNLQSFADFGYFLGAEEFTPEREISRPFLEALQIRIDRMIDPISQNLINDTIADIPPHLFGEFVGQLIEQNSRGKRHSATLQWLRLVSFPSEAISPEIIIDKIIRGATFPGDLKTLFINYLQQEIKRDTDGVKSQLLPFKPATASMMHVEFRKVNLPRRAGSATGGRGLKVIAKTKDSTTEPEKQAYQLTFHGRGPIFPGQLETYIADNADRLAADDQRMRSDIKSILSALETDPFGFGVAKLTSMKITSSEDAHRPLALRRFRADQRPGLTLNHEESRRLRVVFYLDPRINPNEVIIYDILNHDEFDKKFT